MPLCVERGDVILHNGFAATPAFGCKHIEIIGPAIRFAIPFMKTFFPKLLPTLGAEEVLCVPCLLKGCHTFLKNKINLLIFVIPLLSTTNNFGEFQILATNIENWSVAVRASRWEQIVVIRFAIGPAVTLEEVPRAQFLVAMSAGEMLRMPRAAQSSDDLNQNSLLLHYHETLDTCELQTRITSNEISPWSTPVRQWASRTRCSIPSGASVLLGGSCLPGGIRAYAQERQIPVAAGCCGSVPATRVSRGIREFLPRLLCRSPTIKNDLL